MATENIYKEESAFVIIMQRGRVVQMPRLSHRRAFSLYKIQCICICARAHKDSRAAGALTHNASPGAELHSRNAEIVQRYYRIKRNFSSLPLIVCLFIYLFLFLLSIIVSLLRCAHRHHADRAPRYFNPAAHTEGKENCHGWCQETDFVFQLLKENFDVINTSSV
jgi:cbb3-type cytochrome oxidase subunit 3